MNHKTSFYSRVIKEHPESETAKLLKSYPDCEYYELCQSFLDVALNALTVKNDDGSLAGMFRYSDMDIAKQKAAEFLANHNIYDVDDFFVVLDRQYPFSASPDDKRQKGAAVKENCKYFGYIGTWYNFTHISDKVYSRMVDDIKETLKMAN